MPMKISWISRLFQAFSLIITRTNVRVNAIVRGIASTASVDTLAKNGVGRSRFTCRVASKSGEYPHRKNRAFRLTAETLCFHFWDSPKPFLFTVNIGQRESQRIYQFPTHRCPASGDNSVRDPTSCWCRSGDRRPGAYLCPAGDPPGTVPVHHTP